MYREFSGLIYISLSDVALKVLKPLNLGPLFYPFGFQSLFDAVIGAGGSVDLSCFGDLSSTPDG